MNRREKIAYIRTGRWFGWGDVVVLAAALLLTAVFFLAAFYAPREPGASFSVCYRGEKIFTADLEKDAEYLFYIEGGKGFVISDTVGAADRSDYNRIRVSGGSVCVTEADCPDRTCISFGRRSWGEIVCLAHEMTIVIEGGGLETDI